MSALPQEKGGFRLRGDWPAPGEKTFRDILAGRAATDPDHPFLIWDGGRLTIGELHRAATTLANALLDRGLRKGDVVALMLDQHAEHIVALYACAMIGVVRTSINVNAKGDYLSLLLADARPKMLIAEAHYRAALEPALAASPVPCAVWRHDGAEAARDELGPLIASGAATPPPVRALPRNWTVSATTPSLLRF